MHQSSRSWSSSSSPFQEAVVGRGRYSAEERRERIDKYRSKRRHRNFGKRITVSSYIDYLSTICLPEEACGRAGQGEGPLRLQLRQRCTCT
ncbi:hypothetical protein E2562_038536 [Oryza meyeriana var. granulata]|uniref:CCT domain-containing protein n=1 Tax=Oryza meyeriana var. granulata TaxID=110450 RepID=A0A6G1BQZ3_9ORYZ|nr:hypothetical protein E2562_038536 [Oryza meyeriana var. granulata]